MKVRLSVLILIITCQAAFASSPRVKELRTLFYLASHEEKYCAELAQHLSDVTINSEPILLSYKAMVAFMSCKYRINPYLKLTDFNKGRYLLEQAAGLDAGNIEIRFLRFSVQTQTPGILGYKGNVREDKNMILSNWKKIDDQDLKCKIKAFMLQYGECNAAEKSCLE